MSKVPLIVAVVDDDRCILEAVRLAFADAERWEIRTYGDGETLLEDVARGSPPACLVLDPHLPGISGADVARALLRTARVPIVGLTALPTSPLATEMAAAGALVVLTKPVAYERLMSAIEAAIDLGRTGPQPRAMPVRERCFAERSPHDLGHKSGISG